MRYRRTKRDANHAEIVAALRAVGCSVVDLAATGGGCPDLLCSRPPQRTFLLEVKNPKHRKIGGEAMDRTREKQAAFRSTWHGELYTVETADEARRRALLGGLEA